MIGNVILNLAKLANGQPAPKSRRLRRLGIFLDNVRGHKLSERRNACRLARDPRGQKLRGSEADWPEDFVASEKIDNFHMGCASGIARFKRGQKRLDSYVEGEIFKRLTWRRLETHFVSS